MSSNSMNSKYDSPKNKDCEKHRIENENHKFENFKI